MLTLFRTSSPISILLFVAYLILTQWGIIFRDIPTSSHESAPLAHLLNTYIYHSSVIAKICYILVCTYVAVIVNLSLNKLRLSTFENSLFGVITILFISITSSHVINVEITLALALSAHALLKLLTIDTHENIVRVTFDIGFLLGLASLFVMPFIYLLPAYLIGIAILRPFSLKAWLIILSGIICVYFISFSILFWQDQHINQLYVHFISVYSFRGFDLPQSYWGVVGSGAAFILWAATVVFNRYRNMNIMIRNQISVLIWFSFIAIIINVFHFEITNGLLAMLTLPAVYIVVLAMNQTKRWNVVEWIHLLVVSGLIYQQYLIFAA